MCDDCKSQEKQRIHKYTDVSYRDVPILLRAGKCKTIQRAIQKLLFSEDLAGVHANKMRARLEIAGVVEKSRLIEEKFASKKYRGLDMYRKLMLLESEDKKLYEFAMKIL